MKMCIGIGNAEGLGKTRLGLQFDANDLQDWQSKVDGETYLNENSRSTRTSSMISRTSSARASQSTFDRLT
jgi:hypothetical protein